MEQQKTKPNQQQKETTKKKTQTKTKQKKRAPFSPFVESVFSPLVERVQNQKWTILLLQVQSTGQFCGTGTANGSSAAGNVCWAPSLPHKYTSYMQLK